MLDVIHMDTPEERLAKMLKDKQKFKPQDVDAILATLKPKTYKKGELILRQGEMSRTMIFIGSGLVRAFYTHTNGEEHTIAFARQFDWAGDIDGFLQEMPSQISLEALSDTSVLALPGSSYRTPTISSVVLERLMLQILKASQAYLQKRLILQMSMTAEEMYWLFLREYPELQHELTNKQIASYLGVSGECISRIRKRATY